MNYLISLVEHHQVIATGAVFWTISALLYALPEPVPSSSVFYVVAYRLVHFAAANMKQARGVQPTQTPEVVK
jgi:hypothetical protein